MLTDKKTYTIKTSMSFSTIITLPAENETIALELTRDFLENVELCDLDLIDYDIEILKVK